MTLNRAILEIDSTINGNAVTGEFHMVGNLSVSELTKPNYVMSDDLGNVNSIVQRATGNETRRGIYFDLGAGTHQFEFEFNGWDGATDGDGNDVPWGDTSYNSPTVYNATGADAFTQMQVFQNYLRNTVIDSMGPARLRVGEYAPEGLDGFDDVLYVAPQNPRGVHAAEDYSTFDGNYTFVEVERADIAIDVRDRVPFL